MCANTEVSYFLALHIKKCIVCVGAPGVCVAVHAGSPQKQSGGKATLLGARASGPHVWDGRDRDSHPGLGGNPNKLGWQALHRTHRHPEEVRHAHEPAVCPQWRVSGTNLQPHLQPRTSHLHSCCYPEIRITFPTISGSLKTHKPCEKRKVNLLINQGKTSSRSCEASQYI